MLDENQIVDAVCAHLEAQGYEIVQSLHTHQQGIDIVARNPTTGAGYLIEAKGGTSSSGYRLTFESYKNLRTAWDFAPFEGYQALDSFH